MCTYPWRSLHRSSNSGLKAGSREDVSYRVVKLLISGSISRFKHEASCSNIGRIRTKENIAIQTWGFLFKHRSYSNQREHSCSNIGRIRTKENIAIQTWGFLSKHRSYSNQREHSCSNIGRIRTKENIAIPMKSVGDLVGLNRSYTSGGLGHVLTTVMPSGWHICH